ncbi:MAG: peroxiredoxin family protein [Actinomycetota bacterium]
MPLQHGDAAPEIPGAPPVDGPRVAFFYKVTCPTCQLSAPAAERFHRSFRGRLVGIGQDPADRLQHFAGEYGLTFDAVSDPPPYETSDAYGIRTVPTLFLVDDGRVVETVESWDRDGWNALAARMGELVGAPTQPVSTEHDGLPPFRPG